MIKKIRQVTTFLGYVHLVQTGTSKIIETHRCSYDTFSFQKRYKVIYVRNCRSIHSGDLHFVISIGNLFGTRLQCYRSRFLACTLVCFVQMYEELKVVMLMKSCEHIQNATHQNQSRAWKCWEMADGNKKNNMVIVCSEIPVGDNLDHLSRSSKNWFWIFFWLGTPKYNHLASLTISNFKWNNYLKFLCG